VEARMTKLFDKGSGALIGVITDSQLDFLIDQLEEESLQDQDYAITPMTLALFEGEGGDPILLAMLSDALGGREEMTIYWENSD
jgi:hypothetical protein